MRMKSNFSFFQEQLEQLREQRRQLAELQRTAAAPTNSRRESFRLVDCGHGGQGVDVDDDGGRDLPVLIYRQSLGWRLQGSQDVWDAPDK